MMRNLLGIFAAKNQRHFSIKIIGVNKTEVSDLNDLAISIPEEKHSDINIFSEACLLSQMYETQYLVINMYESDKIEFITMNCSIENIERTTFEAEVNMTSEKTSKDDEIIFRMALYKFNYSSSINQARVQGSMYDWAASHLAGYLFGIGGPLNKINMNKNDFYNFLIYCKNSEIEKASPELKIVMDQHDKKHDCFDKYNQPSLSKCVIS